MNVRNWSSFYVELEEIQKHYQIYFVITQIILAPLYFDNF